MLHRVLASALLLLLAVSLSAQTRDSVTIEVVDVPVFVTRGLEPVEGLTRDDFELYVNGWRQNIDYFDVVAADDAGSVESLRERRMFLLLFDLTFSPPHTLTRTQAAAAALIAQAPSSDYFAVATFSSRRGVWFATPFTRDRVALTRAVGALSNTRSGDPLSIVMSEGERESMHRFMRADLPERSDYFNMSLGERIAGEALRDIWAMQTLRAAEDQVQEFRDLARRLAVLQGQKHVVVLSGGFDAGPSRHPWEAASSARNARFNYEESFPPVTMWGTSMLHRYLNEMHRAFQAGDILMHTLDVKGLQPYGTGDALYALATGTGGRVLHRRNDLKAALADLSKSVSASYVIGFKPTEVKRGHNKITVRLKDRPRGVSVRHRKGFSGTPKDVDINEGLYLADVVLNDVPQTGTAASLETRGNVLRAVVPMRQVAAQLGGDGRAHLLVYVFNKEGAGLAYHRQSIDVKNGATDDRVIEITLPEGAVTAKALLAVDDSLGFSKVSM